MPGLIGKMQKETILVAVQVNRTEEMVADRVGNVEVVPGHQTPVVMT